MLDTYPSTESVIVSATQSWPDGTDKRTLDPKTFSVSTDPLYAAIRGVPAPVLAFDEVLHLMTLLSWSMQRK